MGFGFLIHLQNYPLIYHSIIIFSIVKTNFIKNIIKLVSW